MTDESAGRLARLRQCLPEAGIDALLVCQPENRRYLSGFSGSSGWLLVSAGTAALATDSRYWDQAEHESPEWQLVKYGQGGRSFAESGLPAFLALGPVQRLGFEADYVTYAEAHAWMERLPGLTWVPVGGLVARLRAIKDAVELATLRRAVAIADEALAAALGQVRPGQSERELAWLIDSEMRAHGADDVAFDTVVAAGPNAAQPHHHPGDRLIGAGEPVVIDMGACAGGYRSDLTRTVCLGEPLDGERFWSVYDTVLRAQTAAEAALGPGAAFGLVDAAARDLIGAAGYGDYFGHGLGHGVGLAVHEDPFLRQNDQRPLVAGNLVTIEPGIYIPGWGGVRIEDLAWITEDGAEVLTTAPKRPIIRLS
jgi:Xaa-Pro aminopeptidase